VLSPRLGQFQDIGQRIVFGFNIGYAYKEGGTIEVASSSKGKNTMLLELDLILVDSK
jgi:hypothetical protein